MKNDCPACGSGKVNWLYSDEYYDYYKCRECGNEFAVKK